MVNLGVQVIPAPARLDGIDSAKHVPGTMWFNASTPIIQNGRSYEEKRDAADYARSLRPISLALPTYHCHFTRE